LLASVGPGLLMVTVSSVASSQAFKLMGSTAIFRKPTDGWRVSVRVTLMPVVTRHRMKSGASY